jgi:2-C-methyl-D-erythritol 4-phosphate cytidylyltransferase
MRTVAVVLAGGAGLRLGGTAPKQLQLLASQTLLERCVAAFQRAPAVDQIVVVIAADFQAQARQVLGDRYAKVSDIITGGKERPDSTRSAIDLLSRTWPGTGGQGAGAPEAAGPDCNVLFHDAARPLVDQRIIADCVAALDACEAVGVVLPSADTIVAVTDGVMTSMPPRESVGRCQTPQGFRLSVIRRAHQRAAADPRAGEFRATDDCGIVLRYLPDVPVRAVPGSERNLKITYPGDLRIAELLLGDGS